MSVFCREFVMGGIDMRENPMLYCPTKDFYLEKNLFHKNPNVRLSFLFTDGKEEKKKSENVDFSRISSRYLAYSDRIIL